MMNQTYYDYMIKPIIREANVSDIGHLPKMKIQSGHSVLETKWFDVSADQLKEILKVLNKTI